MEDAERQEVESGGEIVEEAEEVATRF